ncbi:hypothetical protein PUMCH_002190 [Australozyma saopauloensis]|uniref:C2H2-type domain-containing protein n=1 Tax=Australozyma saopauloensis TaxID=291208 RepID=A0AAX4H9E5_9ASCO|nr:hypothetical protein PUMCH_002190 [[Candida] saopauloensis]
MVFLITPCFTTTCLYSVVPHLYPSFQPFSNNNSPMETQRQLLEELDVLEWAISQRFKRNPLLAQSIGLLISDPIFDGSSKRSHKETLTQQHELKYFADQHHANRIRVIKGFERKDIDLDLAKWKDPQRKFELLLQSIKDVDLQNLDQASQTDIDLSKQFAMYLSAPIDDSHQAKKKRKYFLSAASAHINEVIDTAFTASEMYGRYVDLLVFFEMYQALGSQSITYLEYLKTFLLFETPFSGSDYLKYLESLLAYLENFYRNIHPFQKIEYPEFLPVMPDDQVIAEGVANSEGGVYCEACDKMFAKNSVYEGHLSGKKHKKNASKIDSTQSSIREQSSAKDHQTILQQKLKFMGEKLKEIIDHTINDHRRRAGLSERERILEIVAIQGDESDFTELESDSDGSNSSNEMDEDNFYGKDLPLGPDGIPIPLWLYKLQGLHRSYMCEICGNISYKGRLLFNKHFTLAKHIHGLTCLGVDEEDVGLFSNIHSIEEAEELRKKIKRAKRRREEVDEDAIEIEDEDGNIMSQKDFLELKKQGLI